MDDVIVLSYRLAHARHLAAADKMPKLLSFGIFFALF